MYDRILFPTDGGEGSMAVFDHVLDVAAAADATLHVLTVADTTKPSVTRIQADVIDVLEREGEQIIETALESASNRGVPTVTAVLQGKVPDTIATYAEAHEIDLIAMATQGRIGLEQQFLGSTTERVLRRATVPVLTLRPDDEPIRFPYRTVVVPTDGSDCAIGAIDYATDIAATVGATLHVLSVVDVTMLGTDDPDGQQLNVLEETAEQIVEEATTRVEDASIDTVIGAVDFGSSVSQTLHSYVSEHDIDLVVMGTHGRRGLDRYLLGSVAERTVRNASVPVLIVPPSSST
ncbi:MAG: universal stress protein [Halobacteriota archaeon]